MDVLKPWPMPPVRQDSRFDGVAQIPSDVPDDPNTDGPVKK